LNDTNQSHADLSVSRTPIVIALKMLEKEILLKTKPRRGHYVRTFTKREIIDALDLRKRRRSWELGGPTAVPPNQK
jgi:DNA-binding GntR family transcriptional regulator